MLQLKNQKVTVWDPKPAERIKDTIVANISSSRKQDEKTYTYYSWNAKFVGRAFGPAQQLKSKDRIELKEAALENYYDKTKAKLYVTVIVFEFEKIEQEESVQEANTSHSEWS